MIWDKDFKGYINDVGGPTANFRHMACEKQKTKGACINKQCLFPTPCKNLEVDHKDYLTLLRKLRNLPGVKRYLSAPVSVLIILYRIRTPPLCRNCVSTMSADS